MRRVIGGREDRGAYDYWGCVADYEQELTDEAKRETHEIGTCDPKHCDWCEDDKLKEAIDSVMIPGKSIQAQLIEWVEDARRVVHEMGECDPKHCEYCEEEKTDDDAADICNSHRHSVGNSFVLDIRNFNQIGGLMEETELEVMPVSALESMTRGEINSQIETAHRFPRSMERFKTRATEMATIDDETAASCIYRRPVGKGDDGQMKFAEGMSIRMAEIVGSAYGNLRVYAMLIDQTDRQVVARGMAMDLEANFASSSEVVESTVDSKGRPYSERMRAVVAKAALAKARRDATFQVVPKALARPIEQAVRKLLMGESKSLEKRRTAVVQWIATLTDQSVPSGKFDASRVWKALGVEGAADLAVEHMETLTGIRTAIKDNETTLDEAFPRPTWKEAAQTSAETGGPVTSYKAQLTEVLLQAGGNSAKAKELLKGLTGKIFIANVSETEAKQALEEFAKRGEKGST